MFSDRTSRRMRELVEKEGLEEGEHAKIHPVQTKKV